MTITTEGRNLPVQIGAEEPVTYISSRIELMPNWHEMWTARELLYFLILREIKVRYKQTAVGAGWAILQPFLTMIVFSVFFGNVMNVSSEDVPYPIFSYTGLVPWTFFATAMSITAESVIANAHVIRKVYIPRLILPLAATVSRLVDFVAAFGVLLVLMLAYGLVPSLTAILVIPVMTMLLIILSLGIGIWLAVFNVYYRDIRQLVPFLVQLWMFATPVIYPATLLDKNERVLYSLNPMVSVVEGFRAALLGTTPPTAIMLSVSIGVALTSLITGVIYFQKRQDTFTDVV